jgi:hypothetical protein
MDHDNGQERNEAMVRAISLAMDLEDQIDHGEEDETYLRSLPAAIKGYADAIHACTCARAYEMRTAVIPRIEV